MEDAECAVVNPGTIVYKQVLDYSLIKEINEFIDSQNISDIPLSGILAHRTRIENIPDDLKDQVKQAIITTINNSYAGDIKINNDMRIYIQTFGNIKPHVDIPTDGESNITCLIYLSDGYEGGELNIKIKEKHLLFNVSPKKGYAILFLKKYLHYANEVFGCKRILLVDLKSDFLITE